ncbi:MAG: xanthine dehydrogenase small subunit [Devosia sp.]|nr:xanthine dehydrogenase small subunit [Devosia sp.]
MPSIRAAIRFCLNDEFVELTDIPHQQPVLDFLRLERALVGTKEGCAEGDCGACTILVGRLKVGGDLIYEPINACIRMTASLDGMHVVTIENLRQGARLHPVQQAMVDYHSSQCGFCTPGIVMSLYHNWLTTPQPTVKSIERSLQGNLCRCTGYAPILRAAQATGDYGVPEADPLVLASAEMAEKLQALQDEARIVLNSGQGTSILPADTDDLAAVLEENPDAAIVAGSTDVGLWVTKQMRHMPTLVFLSRVAGLKTVTVEDGCLSIGGAVTYAEAEATIGKYLPELARLWPRIGGEQVRHAGTIGGNIANGSPIGDTPPALIALGAEITLRHGKARRVVRLEDFFIAYGKQDRTPGEFIERIDVPLLHPDERFAVYKVSKRFDEDITSVLGAFRLRLEQGRVADVTVAYGGMAGIPKRATAVEAALQGQVWSRTNVEAAISAFGEDFQPLDDWRASAAYRNTVARNLLLRFWAETTGENTDLRALAHA